MRTLLSIACALLVSSFALAADDWKPEPGFELLLNGKDLSGWKPAKGSDSFEGKTESPEKRFKIVDGVLVLDPKVKGDLIINTTKEIAKDVVIRFDFQPGKGCNNDLFFRGTKFDIKEPDVMWKENEWNSFEIVAKGKEIEFKVNDRSVKKLTAKSDSSVFGIRAEFGPIQIRRLRVKTMQ